jgi:hypothetical protein
MLTHVVLLQPRPDLGSAEREAFVAAFERAVREIPDVRGVKVGRRVLHGAGYEAATAPADFLALIDFDDVTSLQSYLGHPAHAELGRMFGVVLQGGDTARRGSAVVYDFEVGGIERLREFCAGPS